MPSFIVYQSHLYMDPFVDSFSKFARTIVLSLFVLFLSLESVFLDVIDAFFYFPQN